MENPSADASDPMSVLRRVADEAGIDFDIIDAVLRAEQESRPPLSGLRELEAELWTHFNTVALHDIEGRQGLLVIAAAWLACTYRHAHAAFQLWDLGLSDTASSVARTALEHSVYLSLLASVADAQEIIDRLEIRFLGTLDKVLTGASEAEEMPDLIEALLGQLPARDPTIGAKWMDIFQQVCDRLKTGDSIYRHYRLLCSEIHPGFGTATFYIPANVAKDDQSPYVLAPIVWNTDIPLLLSIDACVWAGWAVDALFEVNVFDPVVAPIASRMGIHPIVRKSEHPPTFNT